MPRYCSADAYLYWDSGELQLGITVFEYLIAEVSLSMPGSLIDSLGPAASIQTVDWVGLFDCEMYISRIHGGHGSGKTLSFKRCVFLKNIGKKNIADILVEAIKACPSPLCYLHLLHGGGAIRDVTIGATAFGSRGQRKEAGELGMQVLETHKQVLGLKHPDTLTIMDNLASTYRDQGRWKEAEHLEMQVMETRKKVLGPEHPDTLTSMDNLTYT
ncbi:hypothetical protein BJX76DRAFT_360274 [Aspergillus varians]